MEIGFIGLGKLGYVLAASIAYRGHNVVGYDIIKENMTKFPRPYKEAGWDGTGDFNDILPNLDTLSFSNLIGDAVVDKDIVCICVGTPHGPQYEGVTYAPEERKDFDYTDLIQATKDVVAHIKKDTVIAVFSTVLPTTMRTHIQPLLNEYCKFVYCPQTPAMGTSMRDFLTTPEFYLLGVDDEWAAEQMTTLYRSLNGAVPVRRMSVESAELCKVVYNTFITAKISYVQTIMETVHRLNERGGNLDVDDITQTLQHATKRLVSPSYMTAGMHDAGACFVPGTLFYTENGMKAVEDIRVGDRVLGYDGKLAPITHVWERDYEGEVYTVETKGLLSLTVTKDHNIPTYKDERTKHWSKVYEKYRYSTNKSPISSTAQSIKKQAQEIVAKQDYLYFPFVTSQCQVSPPSYASDALSLFCGYFIAEGCYLKNSKGDYIGLCFSFHRDEVEYRNEVTKCVRSILGHDETKISILDKKDSLCTSQKVFSPELAKLMLKEIGEYSHLKRVPSWIIYGPLEYSKSFLRGAWRGDGHSGKSGMLLNVTSKEFAFGCQIILNRLRIVSTMRYIKSHRRPNDGRTRKESWELRIRNAKYLEQLSSICGLENFHLMQDKRYSIYGNEENGTYHSVLSSSSKHYSGKVYNITINNDKHQVVSTAGTVYQCHPRDLIALSHLSEKLELSYDFFGHLVRCREDQMAWIAELCADEFDELDNTFGPRLENFIAILGYTFKKESNITTGSSALLVKNILEEWDYEVFAYDPYVDTDILFDLYSPTVILIGMNHDEFTSYSFPKGSVIIDPFRYIPDQDGVCVIRLGEGKKRH